MSEFNWQDAFAQTIARGFNAAVDITIARESVGTPGYLPNRNQATTTQPVAVASSQVFGVKTETLLPLLLVAAGLVVVVKLAKG